MLKEMEDVEEELEKVREDLECKSLTNDTYTTTFVLKGTRAQSFRSESTYIKI